MGLINIRLYILCVSSACLALLVPKGRNQAERRAGNKVADGIVVV